MDALVKGSLAALLVSLIAVTLLVLYSTVLVFLYRGISKMFT